MHGINIKIVCCRSLYVCHYVGFGSGVPSLYAVVASASVMESAFPRGADTYSQNIRRRRKGVWQSYLTEDNASLIPSGRAHLPVSAFCLVWG